MEAAIQKITIEKNQILSPRRERLNKTFERDNSASAREVVQGMEV
jgi:hypothetical protein